MSALIRTSTFVRCFTSFSRSLNFNVRRRDLNVFSRSSQCVTNVLAKKLATQAAPSHPQHDSNLDRSLRRLDQDVRRSGRISRRELEDVLEELRHTRSATSTQSLLIIRCCGNLVPEEPPAVRTQLVEEIWKTLDNLGVPMDISHYNALLRVYLENEHQFSPTEFLADLECKGVEPNRVTYQRLISRYCQQGDIEGATRVLEFMRGKQLPVNESVFNALIMGHSQANDMDSAVGILGVMKQAGLEPSADTYTTLLCGYAKVGDANAISTLLEQCDSNDTYLLDKDYMDVIYTLAANNHTEHVDMLMKRLRQLAGYNQDAVNLILRLVNCGQEDVGLKILKTMPRPTQPDGQLIPVGTFFVKQLIKANRPIGKIISLCLHLTSEGLNSRALLAATECSLLLGNLEQACTLLLALKEHGYPVRQHYFWPLLASYSKSKDVEGALEVLRRMCSQFELPVTGETLRDYIIPTLLSTGTPDHVIGQLRVVGVSAGTAASAMVCTLLGQNNLTEAAQVASRYRAHYSPSLLRRPLVQAFLHTRDTEAFISLLRQIYEGLERASDLQISNEEEAVPVLDRAEVMGQQVLDMVLSCRTDRVAVLQEVLQGLLKEGLGISVSTAERLQEQLRGEELTAEVSSLLAKLTSGDLVPQAVTRGMAPGQPSMDEAQLKSLISSREAKGDSTRGIKRQLLQLYCRDRNLEQAEKLCQELAADNFVFTGGATAQMIELYTHHDQLDQALNHLQQLQEKEPDFALDGVKVIKLATLLVKNDRVQDAVKLLEDQKRERKAEEHMFTYNNLSFQLLNFLAEQGRVDDVQLVFQTLVDHQYVDANNIMLGPLIKVYLAKDDLAGALNQFEKSCLQYRLTPWKNELACRLIQAEDAASLQRLTDLGSQVHGEVNSLYDLVFAFVECGRIRQARKILGTPGLRSRPQRFNWACKRYQEEGMVAPLEGLIEATRDLSHIDRSDIYHNLLLFYCKAEDADKAMGLWTRMQDEDLQPTDEFLRVLGMFLQKQGRDVPFVIPAVEEQAETSVPPTTAAAATTTTTITMTNTPALSPEVQQFRHAIQQENFQEALDIKQRLDSSGSRKLSINDQSLLIEALVQTGQLGKASELVMGMLSADASPQLRVFRYFLNKLAAGGDIDTLMAVDKLLDPVTKKKVSFHNRLCNAHQRVGRASQFLDYLEQEIDKAKEEDLEAIAERFPKGGTIGILENQPELTHHYERLSRKYAARNILSPVNVLWMQHFIAGQDESASKLWTEFLSGSPSLMFQRITKVAREKANADMAQRLVDQLKTSAVSEESQGLAYTCLLDVLTSRGDFDQGMKVLDLAVNDVCLENLDHSTLLRLQKGVEAKGKPFPYKVPAANAKASSSSSSSSSSDDESKPQRPTN